MSKKILSLLSIFFLMLFTLVACGKEGKITIQVDSKMEVGQTYQVKYELEDIKDSVKLTWEVSDPKVAEFDSTKLTIKALAEGSFTITVTAESGETASAKVTVEKGAKVLQGVKLGVSGTTTVDQETGIHVYFQISKSGKFLNPEKVIGTKTTEI